MAVQLSSLGPLVHALRAHGYRVVGPVVRDGAIVLTELDSADALPYGWGVETGPGRYRLRGCADRAAFGHAAGPQSWKQFLHPPHRPLWTAERDAHGFIAAEPEQDPPRYAFFGVRPCDLRAIGVQDGVLGGVDGRSGGCSGTRASTSTSPTCTELRCAPPPAAGIGSGSATSWAPGTTSSAKPSVSAVAAASPGAPSASTSPRITALAAEHKES